MYLRLMTLLLPVSLAACGGGGSSGSAGGPAPPATPMPPSAPVQQELAAFARAGMSDGEDSTPKGLNDVELVSTEDNPGEFDDWFQ